MELPEWTAGLTLRTHSVGVVGKVPGIGAGLGGGLGAAGFALKKPKNPEFSHLVLPSGVPYLAALGKPSLRVEGSGLEPTHLQPDGAHAALRHKPPF